MGQEDQTGSTAESPFLHKPDPKESKSSTLPKLLIWGNFQKGGIWSNSAEKSVLAENAVNLAQNRDQTSGGILHLASGGYGMELGTITEKSPNNRFS